MLAALTMTVGNVVAIAQSNLKRMLAYSSIAHVGYMLVGLVAGGIPGAAAVLFYVFIKGRRQVQPMISGDKPLADGTAAPSRDDAAPRLLALAVFAACAGFAAWIASLRV